jgi:surface antigen
MRKALIIALALGVAAPAAAVKWMRDAAVTEFANSDWDLLRSEVNRVLEEAEDGEQVNWKNPETGNRGALKVIMSFEWNDQRCRRLAALNVTKKGTRGVMNHNLCRQADGAWKFVSDSAIR